MAKKVRMASPSKDYVKIPEPQYLTHAQEKQVHSFKKPPARKNDQPSEMWTKMDTYGNSGTGRTRGQASARYDVNRDKRHRRIETKARLQKIFRGTK